MSWGERAAEQYEKDQPSTVCICWVLGGCDDDCAVCAGLHPAEPCPYDDGAMNPPREEADDED